MRWTLLLAMTVAAAASVRAQPVPPPPGDVFGNRHLLSLHGAGPGHRLGTAVGGAGDVDRDGRPDVIIGAPDDDRNGRSAGSAVVLSGRDGRVLFTFVGDTQGQWFGTSVAGAGDVDRDGHADLIVGAPLAPLGMARVFSGRDGSVIHTLLGFGPLDRFGWSVAGAGDVDGDDHDDLVVGAYGEQGFTGTVRVYSGKQGRLLHTFVGDRAGDWFGWSVAGAGDVDRDGRADVIVGAPQVTGFRNGYARIFSGRSGAVIHTVPNRRRGEEMGSSVSALGDVNGDGYPEVVVGGPFNDGASGGGGAVHVVSGKDGAVLFTVFGVLLRGDTIGWSVAGVGDVDGDGRPDVAAGAPQNLRFGPIGKGFVRVFSGRDGSTIFEEWGAVRGQMFGAAVAAVGDVNGDGRPDVIVGAPLADVRGPDAGMVRVYSGRPLTLFSGVHQLSVGSAGSQTLYLDAGARHAGKLYRLAGSLAGTWPGIPIGPFRVPLNPDAYLFYTLLFPNLPPLADSLGRLDPTGRAQAVFTVIPELFEPLAGLTVHHAYVVIDPGIVMASDPVPLVLVP